MSDAFTYDDQPKWRRSRLRAFEFVSACVFSHDSKSISKLAGIVSASSWIDVVEIATDQLVAPAVAKRIEESDFKSSLPDPVRDYFSAMLRLNRLRNQHIMDDLAEAVRLLNTIGIVPLLIKGAALLVSEVYPDPKMRILSDLDVVILPDQIAEALGLLVKAGYQFHPDDHPFSLSVGSLTSDEASTSIDLHQNVLAESHGRLLSTSEVFVSAAETSWRGGRVLIPCQVHRVILNIAHAQLRDRNYLYGHIPLRSLCDLHYLSSNPGATVALREARNRFLSAGYRLAFDYHLRAGGMLSKHSDVSSRKGLVSRLLLNRALWLLDHPSLHRIDNRLLRAGLQIWRFIQAIFHTTLRKRLVRNVATPLWRRKHLNFLWSGRRTL